MREPHEHRHEPIGPLRRDLLRAAAIAGAGAGVAALAPLVDRPAVAHRTGGKPDPASPQFTLAIMPDTQFLYWGDQDSINSAPQEASFRYIIESAADNIVFMAHLGDLTQDGGAASFAAVDKAFALLDRHGVGYSVLAGNHDVAGDDTRGSTPYLRTMGPRRFQKSRTFAGADA